MTHRTDAYQRIEHLVAGEDCVILDGSVATELQRIGLKDFHLSDKGLWGTWALYHAPYAALEVHRRYIVSTDRWAITSAPEMEARSIDSPQRQATLQLLARFVPREKYDVVVASLYHMPVDPLGEITGQRPVGFWGRNLLDHLILLLPDLLADDGVAYLMQVSVLSQLRTAELVEKARLSCRVADFSFFHFSPLLYENIEQIRRVEQLSDAYHLKPGDEDVMVMYLLEIRPQERQPR